MAEPTTPIRRLVIVLGDQLDHGSTAFDGFDPAQDRVWMAEVAEESTHVGRSSPASPSSCARCGTSRPNCASASCH
jgi:deoxyribodipyrimidine photolyase-related protein